MRELLMDLSRLDGIVEEVDQLVADGLDAAAMVLGTQTGKVGRFTESYGELHKQLRKAGADPQRALDRDS
jgi:hypothetical protein